MINHLVDGKINYVAEEEADGTYTVTSFDLSGPKRDGETEAAQIPSRRSATVIGTALANACISPKGVFHHDIEQAEPQVSEPVKLAHGGDRYALAFGYRVERFDVNNTNGRAKVALVAPDGTRTRESKGVRAYRATHAAVIYYPGDERPILFSLNASRELAEKTVRGEIDRHNAFPEHHEDCEGWVLAVHEIPEAAGN